MTLIILPLDTLIPLHITLNEKLEQRARREFVFPKELILFFFFVDSLNSVIVFLFLLWPLENSEPDLWSIQFLCRLHHL